MKHRQANPPTHPPILAWLLTNTPCLQLSIDPRVAINGRVCMNPNYTEVEGYLRTYITEYLLPPRTDNTEPFYIQVSQGVGALEPLWDLV